MGSVRVGKHWRNVLWGKNIYFIYNGLLSWRFYWRAVTGSRHWVTSQGLGIQVLLQKPPRDLDLSSEVLISWAADTELITLVLPKWKYTNDLVVGLLFPHNIQKFLNPWIDSGSCFPFVFLSSSLRDCLPQILLVPYSCASCLMTFGIRKQNSRRVFPCFGSQTPAKIAKWMKVISNALGSYFSLSISFW